MSGTDDINACVFCQMFEQTTGLFMVIEPLNPVTPGHKIVFYRWHTEDFTDNAYVAAKVFKRAATWVQDNMPGRDVNIITSKGPAATQSIKHLHIHIIPREKGDGLPLPWTPQQSRLSPPTPPEGDMEWQV